MEQMKIHKSFSLKGKDWAIRYKWNLRDDDGTACDGLCDYDERTIWIDSSLPAEERWDVFIHELIHAVLHEAHLNIGGEVEEIVCESMVDMLKTLFTVKWKRRSK